MLGAITTILDDKLTKFVSYQIMLVQCLQTCLGRMADWLLVHWMFLPGVTQVVKQFHQFYSWPFELPGHSSSSQAY